MSEQEPRDGEQQETVNFQIPIGEFTSTPIRFANLSFADAKDGQVHLSLFAHAPLPFTSSTIPSNVVQVVSRVAMPWEAVAILRQQLDDLITAANGESDGVTDEVLSE